MTHGKQCRTVLRARCYDPYIGRFLSEDPIGLDEIGRRYFHAEPTFKALGCTIPNCSSGNGKHQGNTSVMLCSPFRETDSGAQSALFWPGGVRRLTVLQ